ncbi:hypothetical protein H7U32_07320 [Bifidobacterium pullorum subsp. saeculare]|uniref:CTP synthase n=1 Tax=Bifidobacterium pullorum subsp. saeculare TaxID=78257 RepID=A0A938WZE3_9BIFI|nr:hypothetical protein [Bifidobacterium pullorum]MBM6700109.1 hypothetical protein [Bifidobacterium pullorum subsp. saeculare]
MRRNDALETALAEAERKRHCLWGATNTEQKLLARRERAGELVKTYPRLYARRAYWESISVFERQRQVLRTLQQLHPQWVFCGMSAALIHGINDSKRHLNLIEIVTNERSHIRDYGSVRHRYLRDPLIETVDGVRVTSLARTAFDCSRRHDFPDAMAVLEATLREGKANKEFLSSRFMRLPGTRRRQALAALRFAEGRTENGGEAYAYGGILALGYLKPLLQQSFNDPLDPSRTIRPDFLWRFDGKIIAGELDGRLKYRDPAMYANGTLPDTIIREKEREERLRMICDDVVRFSFREVLDRVPLAAKLDAAGIPRRAGL